jgi:hypothetical protein
MSRARVAATPAEVDRLVSQQVRAASQAVVEALREVEQVGTPKSRRVARHLAGVLRMLQDTGSVVSPYTLSPESPATSKTASTKPPSPTTSLDVEALDE